MTTATASESTNNEDFTAVESPLRTGHNPGEVENPEQYSKKFRTWRLRRTHFQHILDHAYSGGGTETDPYIITWISDDPENPRTFSPLMTWSITALVSSMTLAVSLSSSAYSGAIEKVIIEFGCSEEIAILGLSLMVLGYAIGPLIWAPLSELYGRRQVFVLSFIIYTLWTGVCCAAQNIQTLIVFRFLSGAFGSSALVVPAGQIADLFPMETRGIGIAAFTSAPFIGPSVGPLIGGFLGDAGGWRWVMGFLCIYSAVLTFLGFVFIPETYAPILLRRRAALLSEVTGRKYLSVIDAEKPLSKRELIKKAMVRPWALLFLEPIVLSLTIYMACVYGTLYLCFAAFPIIYQQQRGWSAGVGGLAFLGILVGFLTGVVIIALDNRRFVRLIKETKGHPPPECRLPPVIIGGGLIIIGLAWFAATDGPNIHWASSVVAGFPFGLGFVMVFVSLGNYLVDAYVIYAASVIAGNGIIRSMFGAAFPLFTDYMFQNIGIHWGVAVPGFIALFCFPFPILFYYYGSRLRKKCRYAAEAARLLEEMNTGVVEHEIHEEPEEKSTSGESANLELGLIGESTESTNTVSLLDLRQSPHTIIVIHDRAMNDEINNVEEK